MFENLLGQDAAGQIKNDIEGRRLAPAMLFFGPSASGKGTAALELARALSCEKKAAWDCDCPSCARHRYLLHPDLLCLGKRSFSAEISAARAAFLRERSSSAALTLFIRSLRKLLLRFSPVIAEDDPKLGKLSPLALSIDEEMNELEGDGSSSAEFEKITGSLLKNALKLEAEGIGEFIPIGYIRRAAYWSRLAPQGKRKVLVVENADRMQEGARNSLLKILEEPPPALTIILTTANKAAILPTIQSRLRPYRFLKRESAVEAEVIRRVFRAVPPESGGGENGLINAYLDSFLPVSGDRLYPLAAFFISSLARVIALDIKKQGPLPNELIALGKYTAPIAGGAGFGKSETTKEILSTVLGEMENFEGRAFKRFLAALLSLVSKAARARQTVTTGAANPGGIAYNEIWRSCINEAAQAEGVWNQNPALALERLFSGLRQAMGEAGRS
ncbi:MAG: DNA polymerase III [Treponema sp.]|jgi:DNA polymerase-3 subunit gamma/tau|nr:DNA polymerase III [Treponema sp.]